MSVLMLDQIAMQIKLAANIIHLREIKQMIRKQLAITNINFTSEPEQMNKQINHIFDLLIYRTVQIVEQDYQDHNRIAPCSYAFVLFGSGGREEQSLYSDQDNGIIYEDPPEHSQEIVRGYFRDLSCSIQQSLEFIGFPPCTGRVVCGNPMWCRPITEWKQQLDLWIAEPKWEHIRYLLVIADTRQLYGKNTLRNELMKHYHKLLRMNREIMVAMMRNTLHYKPALGLMGNVIRIPTGPYTNGVEIKYGVYIPLVNGIRLLGIVYGLHATHTLERVELLHYAGILQDMLSHDLKYHFISALSFRQLASEQPVGIIPNEQLTKPMLKQIKHSIQAIKKLQRFVTTTIM